MKYAPLEARVVLIDGPVSVFIHEAPEATILDAYANLAKLVQVAAEQLHKEEAHDPPHRLG